MAISTNHMPNMWVNRFDNIGPCQQDLRDGRMRSEWITGLPAKSKDWLFTFQVISYHSYCRLDCGARPKWGYNPTNTRHFPIAVLMLGRRRRRARVFICFWFSIVLLIHISIIYTLRRTTDVMFKKKIMSRVIVTECVHHVLSQYYMDAYMYM